MRREMLIGAGLGVILFLLTRGVDVIPLVALAGLAAAMWTMPGLRGVPQRFGGRLRPGSVPTVTFEDIGGQATAKKELMECLDFLTDHDAARRLGIRPLKGILLTGPPGTGKTLLAKAAAHHTRSVFLAAAGSEFIEMYAGVGAQRVRELFARARRLAKSEGRRSAIVFIDELEVLGSRRGQHQGHLEYDQTLNQLLVEMDGIRADDQVQVLVMGATNRPDLLDDALLRPGRFDRVVKVDLPDREGRRQILQLHTRNKPVAEDVDLDQIARETFGFSGAHLESLANEAAILALREGASRIEARHFREAVEKVMMGERLDRRPSREELERVAVHEMGHALVSEVLRPGSVASVTITPRGSALGYVRHAPQDDVLLETRDHLRADIAVAVAGALAEEMVLGSRSTGAAGDYQQAVAAARRMVLAGMSPLGVVAEELLTPERLQETVSALIAAVEEEARAIVARHLEVLTEGARLLLERERMSGEELRERLQLPPVPEGERARLAG